MNETLLPFIYRSKLDRLVRDEKLSGMMLSILNSMPLDGQIAFIDSLEKQPVGRPMDQRQLPSGKILVTEKELHEYRTGLIAHIQLLKKELQLGERMKRPHGAGTIFERKDKNRPTSYWVAFVEMEPDPETGKRRRKKLRGQTRDEVEQKMEPFLTADPDITELKRGMTAQSVKRLEQYRTNLTHMLECLQETTERKPRLGGFGKQRD